MTKNGAANVSPKTTAGVWLRRVAWMIGLWSASVLALAAVAYAFRAIMAWVGLSR